VKYIDEFRDKKLINRVADRIKEVMPEGEINIMEVCGTHTQNFFRFGLDGLMPASLRLLSGPGCPVCVSPQEYIDCAIRLTQDKDNIIATFGDMVRVPGSSSTLEKERANSADVRIVYSSLDSLSLARQNPDKKIIFLSVGFETTAPTIALSMLSAQRQGLKNIFFLSALKLIPPAMAHLLRDRKNRISGFLCPGHVSSIIGTRPYDFIPKKYGIGCCVAGFEPLDILEGIYILLRQIQRGRPQVENQYMRVVNRQGNPKAQKIIYKVFEQSASSWRGLGRIADSGLRIRKEFSRFDAEKVFSMTTHSSRRTTQDARRTTQCQCAEVLKGKITPRDCRLFGRACCPDSPVGPCMVSSEGACNGYYKYQKP
jgi:hydrogenase expression/formation protein HypD